MRRVKKTALVTHTPDEMFALVNDIESYPAFLPWCSDAAIVAASDTEIVARLTMSKGGLRRSFTTRNALTPGQKIAMTLVDGPFRKLDGQWTFKALGSDGCEVGLAIEFEFAGLFIDMALGQFFEQTCRSLVDAFIQRSKTVYADNAGPK